MKLIGARLIIPRAVCSLWYKDSSQTGARYGEGEKGPSLKADDILLFLINYFWGDEFTVYALKITRSALINNVSSRNIIICPCTEEKPVCTLRKK